MVRPKKMRKLSGNKIAMFQTQLFDAVNKPTAHEKKDIVNFLHEHLQQYGDPKKDIMKAIDFAVKETGSFGGIVLVNRDKDGINGAVVVNQTGMSGYIPENILVYIAVHEKTRGKGIGKMLMEKAISLTKGDIALHVEANNPARKLYEHLGFTNPYLEMRLKK